jgi:uncharacterized membrane protein
MRIWLAVAAVLWPLVLGAALADRVRGDASVWSAAVYLAASRVCHQRPARSFATAGTSWPVCARCSGLYLAAPLGALAALLWRRRDARLRLLLVLASLPTVASLVFEWTNLWPGTNVDRFAAALPLGAALAFVIVSTVPARVPRAAKAIG